MSVVIRDRLPQFSAKAKVAINDAIQTAAADTLVDAKTKAPFEEGSLRSHSYVKMVKLLHWRVTFYIRYARYQEAGGDGRRRVRNYTTSGTGAGFLRSAGNAQVRKLVPKIRLHAARVRV